MRAVSLLLCGLLLGGCVYDDQLSSLDQQIGALRSELAALRSQQDTTQQAVARVAALPEAVDTLRAEQQAAGQAIATLQAEVGTLGDVQDTVRAAAARLDEQDARLAVLEGRLAALEQAQQRRSGSPPLAALGGVLVLFPLAPLLWLRSRPHAALG